MRVTTSTRTGTRPTNQRCNKTITRFPIEDNSASPKNTIFTPFRTSTSILLMNHYNEVSLLSPSRIGTSRVTLWLSPPSLKISWCPRSSSTRAAPLISYIRELSRGLRSPLTLPNYVKFLFCPLTKLFSSPLFPYTQIPPISNNHQPPS